MKTYFQNLSTELLIKIFEYCDVQELFLLQKTCTRFHEIIKKATGLGNNNPLLLTNQLRQQIRNRCIELLTIQEKYRISNNWKSGIYKEISILKEKKKFIPCLVLTRDHLWLSKGNCIRAYKRRKRTLDVHCPQYSVTLPNSPDVCKFTFKQNCLISGQQDGSILLWRSDSETVYLPNCHKSDINSVDLANDICVSGSRDKYIKIWKCSTEYQQYQPSFSHDMQDRVWSTALCNTSQYLAVGTAGYNSVAPLHIFDLTRCRIIQELGQNFYQGSGILQMKWENCFTLLTCGYDKNIRKWDTRSGACEQSWEDPFYSTVYCFDTDNYCSILTGTQSHGRTVLWDTRSKYYVQVYFMETCKKHFFSSPVYSLSFDVSQLFAATDHYLNILDFSVRKGITRNYNIFDAVRKI